MSDLLATAEEMATALGLIAERMEDRCGCEGVTGGRLCVVHRALQTWHWWQREHPVAANPRRRIEDVDVVGGRV